MIPLFWGPPERFISNYELFENSIAPEKLPSGGLFSVKNFTLEALYAEHRYARNVWTVTNNDLPFVRYTGCKIKIYRPETIDLIVSYSNTLPMTSNLDLYETLHPGIHSMVKNKILVTSTKKTHRKPYRILKIPPPTPMQNKWYFAADISKVPLCQIRSSATTLEEYYINQKSISTSMTIYYLNPGAMTNTNYMPNKTTGYYARKHLDKKIYLYSAGKQEINNNTLVKNVVFLGNTSLNQAGTTFPAIQSTEEMHAYIQKYQWENWGNPFYTKYLTGEYKVYFSEKNLQDMFQYIVSKKTEFNTLKVPEHSFTQTTLTHNFRYNPFNDQGLYSSIYILSNKDTTDDWSPPISEDLQQSHLPLWILTFGFLSFQRKLKKVKNIDTEQLIVLRHNVTQLTSKDILPIIDPDFLYGRSPYEKQANPIDFDRWNLCTQFQYQTLNNIAMSGPGAPRIPTLESCEAKINYCFYFKWGGNLPPMSTITDPSNLPHFHLPTNFSSTNSLQNPADNPERLLYSFDERRGNLTERAIKRLQKDIQLKEISFTDGTKFQEIPQSREESSSQTSTSEEEDETQTEKLLLKLNKQRLQHKQLKLRIIQQLGYLPKLK